MGIACAALVVKITNPKAARKAELIKINLDSAGFIFRKPVWLIPVLISSTSRVLELISQRGLKGPFISY